MQSEDQKELLKQAEEAWAEFERYHYEVVAPHFYREKRGRKLEYINPWKDIKERIDSEEYEHQLYEAWLHLFQRYVAQYGERPYLPILWTTKDTPDGVRWVKRELSPPAPH